MCVGGGESNVFFLGFTFVKIEWREVITRKICEW